jgi:hypothetical protein
VRKRSLLRIFHYATQVSNYMVPIHKLSSNASAPTLSPVRKKYFMIDPSFPTRLLRSGNRRTMEFIQFLSTEYSRRGLTNETDRSAAFSGVEASIAWAKDCESRFGIFELFLHRCLLWQRSEDQNMTQIGYGIQVVPSWSWMAYNGSIRFMNIHYSKVEWVHGLRFNERNEHRQFNEG